MAGRAVGAPGRVNRATAPAAKHLPSVVVDAAVRRSSGAYRKV